MSPPCAILLIKMIPTCSTRKRVGMGCSVTHVESFEECVDEFDSCVKERSEDRCKIDGTWKLIDPPVVPNCSSPTRAQGLECFTRYHLVHAKIQITDYQLMCIPS